MERNRKKNLKDNQTSYSVIGIDEVGRGPFAGPVVVTALIIKKNFKVKNCDKRLALKDSKKLTQRQREEWLDIIKNYPKISFATSKVSGNIIDKINIKEASNKAATEAFYRLIAKEKLNSSKVRILLDAGLYVSAKRGQKLAQISIVKGDEIIPEIMLASIIAKVSRDALMDKMHKKYPKYGFNINKGYGTKKHRDAIKKYGPCKIHRLTFIRKYISIDK